MAFLSDRNGASCGHSAECENILLLSRNAAALFSRITFSFERNTASLAREKIEERLGVLKGRLHFFEAMLHLEGILQEKKGIPYHMHKEYKYWTSERMTAIFLSVGEKARKSGRKDINKTHTAHVFFGD